MDSGLYFAFIGSRAAARSSELIEVSEMSLSEKLDQRWRRTQEDNPELARAYEALIEKLVASRVTAGSLKAGDSMPDFELPSADGRFIASCDLLARGPLVLSFFRGGWCPYCTLELRALQAALPEIETRGASLAAVTADTGAALAAAKRENALGYDVLSDADHGLGLTFGVVFRVPDAIRDLYQRLGIDLDRRHGNKHGAWLLPIPATYIIDRRGVIRHAALDPDFRRRMEPAEIIRRLGELSVEQGSGGDRELAG